MHADAFVAHVVVLGGDPVLEHVEAWWSAGRHRLELTEDFGAGRFPPEEGAPAALRSPGSTVEEIVVRRLRDAFSVSILLEPTDDHPWADRLAVFEELSSDLDTPAGVPVFATSLLLAGSADHLDDHLPASWAPLREPAETAAGVVAREGGDADDGRTYRRWVVTGDDEATVAAWAWAGGGWTVPPLVRYLVQAAVLRHHLRQWREQQQSFLDLYRAADEKIDGLARDAGKAASTDAFIRRTEDLRSLQARRTGLVQTLTRLRQMASSTRAVASNMQLIAGTPDGPFGDDSALATWLAGQLEDDAAWLGEVRERADHVAALADQQLRRAELTHQDATRSRQERMSIGLTAVTGAILTALAAIQSLQLVVDVSPEAKVAATALLSTVTLAAGLAVLRLARPEQPWPAVLVLVSVAGVAAAAAAFGVALVPDAGAVTTWLWSASTFVAVLVGGLIERRARRGPSRDKASMISPRPGD